MASIKSCSLGRFLAAFTLVVLILCVFANEVRYQGQTRAIIQHLNSKANSKAFLATEFDYDDWWCRNLARWHRLWGQRPVVGLLINSSDLDESGPILSDYKFLHWLHIVPDRRDLPVDSILRLQELRDITVIDGGAISDFSPLRRLEKLEGLNLTSCHVNSNWQSLEAVSTLRWIRLPFAGSRVGADELFVFERIYQDVEDALPNCYIVPGLGTVMPYSSPIYR